MDKSEIIDYKYAGFGFSAPKRLISEPFPLGGAGSTGETGRITID